MNPCNTLEYFQKNVEESTPYKIGDWYNYVLASNRMSNFRGYGMRVNLLRMYIWENRDRYFKYLRRKEQLQQKGL